MNILNHRLRYGPNTNGNVYRLYFLGDIHLGNILCDKDKLQEDIDEIVGYGPEKAGVVLMGDLGEYIAPQGDRRFDPTNVDSDIIDLYSGVAVEQQTVNALVERLQPLANNNQILAVLGGNHGLQNKSSGRYERWDWVTATQLGVPELYCGYSAFVRLQFEAERGGAHRSILAHVHHGRQAGRTAGSLINQLEREIAYFPGADFIMRGHSHQIFAHTFGTLSLNQRGTALEARKVLVGHTGAYLKTMGTECESYGERALYRPEQAPGMLKTWIRFTNEGYEIFGGVG